MARDKRFENIDKAVAIFLGTPVLIGFILMVLALGSPGSEPYRDRGTVIPIAIGLLVLGGAGGIAYIVWRIRKQRSMDLDRHASAGAIRLPSIQQNPRLIEISFALADHFVLPPGSCVVPAQGTPVTAAQICDSVFAGIQRLEARGQMAFDPSGVKMAALAVIKYARGGSGELRMTSDLNDVIPFYMRRRLWKYLRSRGVALPPLTLPKWAVSLVIVASLAITFGTTIPLAQWLDRVDPINPHNTSAKILATIIVRGGFFALLVACVVVLTLIFRVVVPMFPGSSRTIGHLAAYLPAERPEDMPVTNWAKESVSLEVRRIIALSLRIEENQVRSSTPCS